MELPFEPKKPLNQDPRFMILFGAPKCGKTTICGKIPNSLLIDLEAKSQTDEDGGSWHVECVSLKATCLKDLGQIIKAIKDYKTEHGKDPYDCIIIDHSSKLENIADEYALQLYKGTPQGARYEKKSMKDMGEGYGYR
jgi:replication-associated recombination protein RarA